VTESSAIEKTAGIAAGGQVFFLPRKTLKALSITSRQRCLAGGKVVQI
jgi:hypothetical protein